MRLFWIIAGSLSLATPAAAAPSSLALDVESGADHHVASQGKYHGGLPSSWEWRFGSRRSASNVAGISAHGLIAAHQLTGLSEHHKSALTAAESLIKAYDRGWKRRRPHTQDIEFLVAAGYVIDAARWMGVLSARYNAPAYADHVIDRRRAGTTAALAGWDIASAIRASLGVGQVGYAKKLLDRLIERRAMWDAGKNPNSRVVAYGSLLWSMGELKTHSGLSASQLEFARSLLDALLAAQHKTGGFLSADGKSFVTQSAAYAALGLARWSRGNAAAHKARAWLSRRAINDKRFVLGGQMWASFYDLRGRPASAYHGAVQAEVLRALAGK